MDVLKPQLTWINGRCFRVLYNATTENITDDSRSSSTQYREEQVYEEEEDDYDARSDDDSVLVETTAAGRLQITLHVPQMFFGSIIGPKGDTRKLIEAETGTLINIPRNKTNCDVVITGPKRVGVLRARRRLQLKVQTARQKQRPTHFLSIPMTGKQIQNSVLRFKDEVSQNPDCAAERVESSIFQIVEKLHLTLGMMMLADDYEVKQVDEMLQSFKATSNSPVLRGEPLKINLCGIEYMNDDPANVDILYGKVKTTDGSDNLQRLVDDLFMVFKHKGFITERRETVKLHVTLMNTKFRGKLQDGAPEPLKKEKTEPFDGQTILEKFQDFDFGVQSVDSIHLSKRFTKDSEGFYQTVATLKF